MSNTTIEKRFPADTSLEIKTFLNDTKVDSELYAYLMSMSYGSKEGQTVVYKENLPSQAVIGRDVLHKTRQTVINHLKYLKQEGYVIEEKDKYILPKMENIYFIIPLDTLEYLLNTVKESVIKTYIYLGQRWKWKGSEYEFTLEEIGEHIGKKINNHQRVYKELNDILHCLKNEGLIDYCEYYNGQSKKKKLKAFNLKTK